MQGRRKLGKRQKEVGAVRQRAKSNRSPQAAWINREGSLLPDFSISGSPLRLDCVYQHFVMKSEDIRILILPLISCLLPTVISSLSLFQAFYFEMSLYLPKS